MRYEIKEDSFRIMLQSSFFGKLLINKYAMDFNFGMIFP